jgi:hypothetical protein
MEKEVVTNKPIGNLRRTLAYCQLPIANCGGFWVCHKFTDFRSL